jgi:N-hydroxyarylamine O-acetyltransferase
VLDNVASKRLSAYFARIEYGASTAVAEETLRNVLLLQCWNVPFENIDIHLGRGVSLSTETLFRKLIGSLRGGYCYELNGLLHYILTTLGFHVSMLAGRTCVGGAGAPPKTHLLLLVEIRGRKWIADAAFGVHGLNTCIPLDAAGGVKYGNDTYRVVRERDPIYELQRLEAAGWLALYDFTLVPMESIDFEIMNYFHSTNPASHFRNRVVVSRVGYCTRTLMLDLDLRKGHSGSQALVSITDVAVFRETLLCEFQVDLNAEDAGKLFEAIVARKQRKLQLKSYQTVRNVGRFV